MEQEDGTADITEQLVQEIRDDLNELYGPLIGPRDLWKVLGYKSAVAYRQARLRKRMSVPEFGIEGRSGHFALSIDVARWLVAQRMANLQIHLLDEGEKEC